MQRQPIINKLEEIRKIEITKLATAKAKNNTDKIKLHEDKKDGLENLSKKIAASSDISISLDALKNAINETVKSYPLLPYGTFSEIKKYFNHIAPDWDKVSKQKVAPTNLFFASQTSETEYPLLKVIMLGDSGVGKSAIQCSFSGMQRNKNMPTIGVEFYTKIFKHIRTKLQLWDTPGQERSKNSIKYVRNSHAVILMFDLTETLDNIEQWHKDAQENAPDALIILVGNKCDLQHERKVAKVEAEQYATKKGIEYIEISANNVDEVNQLFETIIDKLLAKLEDKPQLRF